MNTAPLPKPAAWQPLPNSSAPIALVDITSRTCAWPVGEASGAAQLFCGCVVTRRGFCVDHAARAFVKTPTLEK